MSCPRVGKPPAAPVSTGACLMTSSNLSEIRFLTVAEVAELMRVSRMTVYRLVHGGELPAARVGRSFRVSRRAVENHLRAAG